MADRPIVPENSAFLQLQKLKGIVPTIFSNIVDQGETMDQTGADEISVDGTTSLLIADKVFAEEPMLIK